jgi:ribosomal protein S3AE
MKKWFLIIAAGFVAASFTARVLAADSSKEVTLTGTMVCAKCKLHEADKCQNVLQVPKKDGVGSVHNFYLDENKVSKDFHDNICQNDGEKVNVTGTVSTKDGKQVMVASKIEAVK